ncbi:hypothetical protein A4G20_02110 [Pasteurellaceae bacterium RH1A]|nr:hypothetical protein A4G20_02110 [Pasteurellaceae bacterium RH1A]
MQELDIGLPKCYKAAYYDIGSKNLLITFTPSNGFFLYHSKISANKLCIASTTPNYYIFNPGSACKKIIDFIKDKAIENIICLGSSKAGLASILWGQILYEKLKNTHNVFVLSFSPQSKLYPFNENLYFPSYKQMWKTAQVDNDLNKCLINYGDVNLVLKDSDIPGMIIYPEHNMTDKLEAERIVAKNIRLIPLKNYPLHGSFLPFMPQAQDNVKLKSMVKKLYENALKDDDVKATLPSSEYEILKLIKLINAPNIENLIDAIFFKIGNEEHLNNLKKMQDSGFL